MTSAEANERLARFGRNEITRRKPVSPVRLFLKQFANFFVVVLLFAAALAYAVSFLPGESGRRLTAFFILGIIALSVILSFFEEYRAQKELEALDKLLVFKAAVIRDGIRRQVNADEVVPGDVLVLSHGNKVPADARLMEAHSLRADESALTGESVGVDKSPEPVASDAPLAERTSMVFASTYITHGTGTAVAVRTGMTTEVGQIAATLEQMAERPTPFQVEVQKMARQMTFIVGSLAVVVAVILLFVSARAAGGRGAQHAQPGRGNDTGKPAHRVDLCAGLGRASDGGATRRRAATVGRRIARIGGHDLHRQDRHAHAKRDDRPTPVYGDGQSRGRAAGTSERRRTNSKSCAQASCATRRRSRMAQTHQDHRRSGGHGHAARRATGWTGH